MQFVAKIYEQPTFGSTALAANLKALSDKEETELELIGLCTDICIVSNALLLKAVGGKMICHHEVKKCLTFAQGFYAGGKDLRGCYLLCRRDTGKVSHIT